MQRAGFLPALLFPSDIFQFLEFCLKTIGSNGKATRLKIVMITKAHLNPIAGISAIPPAKAKPTPCPIFVTAIKIENIDAAIRFSV